MTFRCSSATASPYASSCTAAVYVPGISAFNREFEYNGVRWVGVRLTDTALVATPALSSTSTLKKKIRLIARDVSPFGLIAPSSKEFEERGEGPAF